MADEESGGPCAFDVLLKRNVPHIFMKIFFSLDYESFKNCIEVNQSWNEVLKSEPYLKKARTIFREEISQDENELHNASKNGRGEDVRNLLSSGMLEVDCEERGRWTPLYNAAHYGHCEVAQLLIEKGADPNKAKQDRTPMSIAAQEGHEDVVRLFLDTGVDPNKVDGFGMTALHCSAQSGHINVARVLLDAGAHPNKSDTYGNTPLHLAAGDGHSDVYQFLLANGADQGMTNVYGETPRNIADDAQPHGSPEAPTGQQRFYRPKSTT